MGIKSVKDIDIKNFTKRVITYTYWGFPKQLEIYSPKGDYTSNTWYFEDGSSFKSKHNISLTCINEYRSKHHRQNQIEEAITATMLGD